MIHTPDRRLRVFVSSTMGELAAERAAVSRAVEQLRLTPVLFELGARPHPPRDLYRAYLRQSEVFVGIYWQRYGWVAPGETISGIEDEYLAAAGKPKLVYLREPADERDPRLAELIDRIRSDDVSYRSFREPDELATLLADDLAVLLSERFSDGLAPVAPQEAPPSAGAARPLPAALDRFVGRSAVLRELRGLLGDPGTRLVTLVGPGGIGKTRLALEVAATVAGDPRDGVHVVTLASTRDPGQVLDAVRSSLGLTETHGASALDQLRTFLAERDLLLVLDNFEQVVEAAPLVADLLAAAPGLRVLVTSREVLRISGEHVFTVPPLDVPDEGARPDDERDSEGVQLFMDRASAVRPDLAFDDATTHTVASIVRRLDGLPLAIELAAARTRLLDPPDLLDRLDRRLGLLTGGPRDLPERQRTLRLTIQWSYELLTDAERDLLDRLGVLVGSFSLDSAEALCGSVGPDAVLDTLSSLVDRSLVGTAGAVGGGPRFTMLETIREFALERLERRGLLDELRERHACHFLDLVVEREADYERGGEIGLVERFTADHQNLRSALDWFVTHERAAEATRFARAVWRFWWVRSLLREGIDHMARVLARVEHLTDRERADASYVLGHLAFGLSDYERAAPHLEEAHRTFAALGDDLGLALVSMPLGVIRAAAGSPDWEATSRDAIEHAGVAGNLWALAAAELGLGSVLLVAGRADEAAPVLARSAEHAREIGTEVLLAYSLVYLGRAHLELGEHGPARDTLDEALARTGFMESREAASRALEGLAALALAEGDAGLGARLFGAAEAARRSVGAPVWRPDEAAHERTGQELRARLGPDAFRAAYDEGLSLPFAEAIGAARS